MKPQFILYNIDDHGEITLDPGEFEAPGPGDWPLVYTVAPSHDERIADRVSVTLAGTERVSVGSGEPAKKYTHAVTPGTGSLTFVLRVQTAEDERTLQLVVPIPLKNSLRSRLSIEFNLLPLPPPIGPQQVPKPANARLPPPRLTEPPIDTRPARPRGRPAPTKNP